MPTSGRLISTWRRTGRAASTGIATRDEFGWRVPSELTLVRGIRVLSCATHGPFKVGTILESFELTRLVNTACGMAGTIHAYSATDALDDLVIARRMSCSCLVTLSCRCHQDGRFVSTICPLSRSKLDVICWDGLGPREGKLPGRGPIW